MMSAIPDVSIIVPMYNSEQLIGRCARSLFEQSFEKLEFIFIDDFSSDNTLQVLNHLMQEFPRREGQSSIIRHHENKGVSSARNTGLRRAKGDYLLMVDSDDWIEPNTVVEMHKQAVDQNSDIVWTDFMVEFQNNLRQPIYKKQNVSASSFECISAVLSRNLHAGLWNKLIKRTICKEHHLLFSEEVTACEDVLFIAQYLLHANHVTYFPMGFYHYFQNPNSITSRRGKETYESEITVAKLLDRLLPKEYNKYVTVFKAKTKRNVIFSGLFSNEEVDNCLPEANLMIYKDLKSNLDRLIIWLALKRQFLLLRIFLNLRLSISRNQ